MTQRKIQALKNLSERPGTFYEGEVARRKLAELECKLAVDKIDIAYGVADFIIAHMEDLRPSRDYSKEQADAAYAAMNRMIDKLGKRNFWEQR